MQLESGTSTRQIYRGRGTVPETTSLPVLESIHEVTPRTSASAVPLHQIMSRNVICGCSDLDIGVVVELMVRHHISCIPIVDERQRPIGIITKSDIVDRVHAGTPLRACTAHDVMMPLAFMLSAFATVANAAMMLMSEDTHHVMVVSAADELVGVVSSRDIVGWVLHADGP